jgi:signal transduction histidine kinase/CheY-like chemotaxis protein
MDASTNGMRRFGSELRVSAIPAILFLAALGLALVMVSETQSDALGCVWVQRAALLCYGLCAATWLIYSWQATLGRWFVIAVMILGVLLVRRGLETPGLLVLLFAPTALAAALIGLAAAAVVAVVETLLLLFAPTLYAVSGTGEPFVALVAIWMTVGLMIAVYVPIYQLGDWLWQYFERAQSGLEGARDRRAELAQALDDLAYANRQLLLTNERLAGLRLIAEEAQKTKTAFVAKVSHEFRTPLNMIIGLVDLLVETPDVYGQELPSALFQDLEIVHRNCEHLSSMVDDVLDLSQAESGRLTLDRERVNLGQIIDEGLVVVRPLLEKKGLALQVDVPHDLPQVYCDRRRIRQVILNLVTNAARFTERGGVTVGVEKSDDQVVVSVADTGSGISPEDAERIFEPFCQGSNALWRDHGGSGLGLSISKEFVELHGGRIWLEGEPGVGTTFFFALPISPPMDPVARPGHWIKEDWVWLKRSSYFRAPDSHFKPRLVICDETGDVGETFAHLTDQIELVPAADLAEAGRDVQECPSHAVLINTALPDDLVPTMERARQLAPDTPIVGCSVPAQASSALEAGAVDYLIKPVRQEDLLRAIRSVRGPVRRILVVDDALDVLSLWSRMLRACSMHAQDGALEVLTASSGEGALTVMRQSRPDLVLLDIVMPGMDGWQVLEHKRRDEGIRDIPIVLVSAQDPMEKPATSPLLVATMGQGLTSAQILRCSLSLSALLLGSEPGRDPGPLRTGDAAPVWADKAPRPAPAPAPVPG